MNKTVILDPWAMEIDEEKDDRRGGFTDFVFLAPVLQCHWIRYLTVITIFLPVEEELHRKVQLYFQ